MADDAVPFVTTTLPWRTGGAAACQVEHYASLASTNDLALQRIRDVSLGLPLLIRADAQTAGRGRGDNRWWSSPGALTYTLVLSPEEFGLAASLWPRVSLVAGVSVCAQIEAVVPLALPLLKWPNDVLLERRKVCGILVEAPAVPPGSPARLVVGVGINLNNSFANAPLEVQQRGIALCQATGTPLDVDLFLAGWLARFAWHLEELAREPRLLAARWQELCALRGRIVTVGQGTRTVSGLCHGIGEEGGLLLETVQGIMPVYTGVVTAITDSV